MNNKIEKLKETYSKEQLEELYINQNMTRKDLAKYLKCGEDCTLKLLKYYDISKPKELILELRKKTSLEKYGVDNPAKNRDIAKKISEKSNSKSKEEKEKIIAKRHNTKQKKYGSHTYNNLEKGRQTKLERYGDPNYNNRDKYKKTINEHYGVDNFFKLPEFIDANTKHHVNIKNYSDEFKELRLDRNKSIDYLKLNKDLSYKELANKFNCPTSTISQWVIAFGLQEYIRYSFDGTSNKEQEIVDYIISLGISDSEIQRNVNILDKQEIDIYLPNFKVGIEFNGAYWHSNLFKDKNYHQNKSILAEKSNIRLIHIWDFEWEEKKDKIKLFLRNTLIPTKTIYARECTIEKLDNKEVREFVNRYHLQGSRNAQITYGLFHDNTLVQIMSFSKSKYNKNLKEENSYEIIRECSSCRIVGGISKLFRHFINDYNPSLVFSYCDFNKFNGIGYEKMGMKFIGYTSPDLKYCIHGQIINRNPKKYKVIRGQMDYSIYGAGNKKYLWKKAAIDN